jgi:tripartite-type tricarboxylate transporter receptor subunit TctC
MAKGRSGRCFILGLSGLRTIGRSVLGLAFLCSGADAQENYPSKSVRMVVPFAAGGPTDTVARVVGAKMADLLGQPFVVENRASAPMLLRDPRLMATRY